jgi:hypothetical protein
MLQYLYGIGYLDPPENTQIHVKSKKSRKQSRLNSLGWDESPEDCPTNEPSSDAAFMQSLIEPSHLKSSKKEEDI